MRSYSLIAPAKINLYLEILGDASGGLRQRPDGYHELAMILQSIGLAERVGHDTSKYWSCRPS